MHQEGRIANAAIETVLVGRNVTLAQALDHAQQVVLNVELSLFSVRVGQTTDGEIAGVVVTTLAIGGLTFRDSFQEFVDEHPIAPTTIVVEQGQRTDGLVESSQVAGVQQKTLRGDQCLASNLEGAGLSGVTRIGRTGVLAKSHEHFVLDDVPAISSTNGLLSGALPRLFRAGIAPETVTIELNGLTGLFREIVNNDRLSGHLYDVRRMGTV